MQNHAARTFSKHNQSIEDTLLIEKNLYKQLYKRLCIKRLGIRGWC